MNVNKTKVMVVSRKIKEIQVMLDGRETQQVQKFEYLSATLEENEKNEINLSNRIKKANNIYYAINKSIISKKEISRETKMKV